MLFLRAEWPRLKVNGAFGAMGLLMEKLKLLRRLVCDWEQQMKVERSIELNTIESSILDLLMLSPNGTLTVKETI